MNPLTSLSFHRPTYAEIDLRRVAGNFREIRALLPEGGFVCPMVKANAYGHGDIEVARALRAAGARHLGVGLIEEGMHLRLSGDHGGLLLFGIFDESSADAVLEFLLTPVISEWHELETLESACARRDVKQCKIHFKFNTGMNRLGFDVDQAPKLREWLDTHPRFTLEGICTHLLRGEDAGAFGGESESQMKAFAQARTSFADLDVHFHALNSSGLANLFGRARSAKTLSEGAVWPMGTRPGLAIYGVQPSNEEGVQLSIKPALSFKSRIVMLHRLQKGERVSYNAKWRAERESLVGVVPVGYADGYFRALSNKGVVLCKGRRVAVIGTICMDYFMIDATDLQEPGNEVQYGDEVVLIGEQGGAVISADEIAALAGTIPYEIFTNISERVPRVFRR
jgi:alanine racemase